MRIGELATAVGVSTDTLRWYEREGLLPRPRRQANGYREYGAEDATHLRLLIDLRRLDIPLEVAGALAASCHSGHCVDSTADLSSVLAARRAEIAARIDGLRDLDHRLASLQDHLTTPAEGRSALPMFGGTGPCCDAAGAVSGAAEEGCSCCGPQMTRLSTIG